MRETPIVVDRRVDGQTVLQPKVVVLQTVARRNMYKPCAGRIFDKRVAGIEFAGSVTEGMLVFQELKVLSIQASHDLVPLPAAFFCDRGKQHRRHDKLLLLHLDERVAEG